MVTKCEVRFDVDGDEVVGTLYGPEGDAPRAALVFTGPLTSVKAQVPGHYAEAMAKRGFLALAIDHRHFGDSGGQPRQYESPPKKVEDIRAAVAFLRSQEGVAHVGAVGVCAGAGYMAAAVAAEPKIEAFGAVAGFFHDADKQKQWMGDGYDAALERAKTAEAKFKAGEAAEMIPAVAKEGECAMPLAEAFEYYGTERGAAPGYENAFAVMSRTQTLPFDAQGAANEITVPTVMIHSEKALAPALARAFFEKLTADKDEFWLESEGQIDFYDDPKMIEPAADRLAEHFSSKLGAG